LFPALWRIDMSRIALFFAGVTLGIGGLLFGREWFAKELKNAVKEI